jgi:hypothetical protein
VFIAEEENLTSARTSTRFLSRGVDRQRVEKLPFEQRIARPDSPSKRACIARLRGRFGRKATEFPSFSLEWRG